MRKILRLAAGLAVMLPLFGHAALAGEQTLVAQAGKLPEVTDQDRILGDPKAKVTIIEYASLTCPHCATFHTGTLPELKKKYIDTGKVRFVYRHFPLDRFAAKAAMLSVCAGPDRQFAVIDVLFQNQLQWAGARDPEAELAKIGRLAGVGEAEFKACMDNKPLLEKIIAERQGGEAAGVNATPTLFIDGKLFSGARPMADLEEALAPLLK